MTSLISPFAIAPMLRWTYQHFRVFMRLLAPHALLYTEMQPTGAILNNPKRALSFYAKETPLALQVGGSNLKELVTCAKIAEETGFAEINLNLGCPSNKVLAGRFGICLMKEPEHVAEVITLMKEAVTIPVTAKIRLGFDHCDSYEFFANFSQKLIDAHCDKLIVHARKAWLKGLSPKENRHIPPINYEFVYKLKEQIKHLSIPIIINGNIKSVLDMHQHANKVDGVMIGRLAYENPFVIHLMHRIFFPQSPLLKRSFILQQYLTYLKEEWARGSALNFLLKPLYNIAYEISGAKAWKKTLMQVQTSKKLSVLVLAIQHMEAEGL